MLKNIPWALWVPAPWALWPLAPWTLILKPRPHRPLGPLGPTPWALWPLAPWTLMLRNKFKFQTCWELLIRIDVVILRLGDFAMLDFL